MLCCISSVSYDNRESTDSSRASLGLVPEYLLSGLWIFNTILPFLEHSVYRHTWLVLFIVSHPMCGLIFTGFTVLFWSHNIDSSVVKLSDPVILKRLLLEQVSSDASVICRCRLLVVPRYWLSILADRLLLLLVYRSEIRYLTDPESWQWQRQLL